MGKILLISKREWNYLIFVAFIFSLVHLVSPLIFTMCPSHNLVLNFEVLRLWFGVILANFFSLSKRIVELWSPPSSFSFLGRPLPRFILGSPLWNIDWLFLHNWMGRTQKILELTSTNLSLLSKLFLSSTWERQGLRPLCFCLLSRSIICCTCHSSLPPK